MKSVSTLTAATILVAIATSLSAGPQPPAEETVLLGLTVDLRDGSRLLGRPVDFEALPLDTSIGKLKIPLVQIKSFEMKDDKESATVELLDGGHLSGTVGLNRLPLQTSIGKLNVPLAEVASCRVDVATVADGNVALASRGATVSGAGWPNAKRNRLALIDGKTTDYDDYAVSKLPSSWVVTLPRTYLLSEIRLLLYDKGDPFYRYVAETSLDGKTYQTAADRSQGKWRSWQKLIFKPRPVRYIRVRGLYGSATPYMDALELEAYCKPPDQARTAFPVLATAKITDRPYGMFCVADFNNDKQLDFAVSDKTKGSESVDVYLNNGDGALIEKASYRVGSYPLHVAAGDFDEDGNVDLIVPVYRGSLGNGTMRVLKGNGDGTFTMGTGFSARVRGKGLHPCRTALGDLNKDGHLDFVVEMDNDWAINIHWGNGDGTFTPKYTFPNGQNPGNIEIAHLDNDGWPDIVAGSQYTSLYVHLSDGDAGYKPTAQYLKGTSRRSPIIVGDLDGDDDVDVLCAHYTPPCYVSIMINDGNGVFTEKGKIDFPDGTGLAKVTDFDFDGKMDFVLGSGNKVLVVPGNGDGTFKTPVAYDMGHKVVGLQLHDLNDDGRLDLVYIDSDTNKAVMRLNTTRPCTDAPGDAALTDPPGEFQVDYAGLRWDLMRTGWKVEDGKLASQRHARPGFRYGHWANGRNALAITGIGDKSWTDYEVAFDFKMLPANREFFHAHIPGDSRGMSVVFRAKSLSESWNQPHTCYSFGLRPAGNWSMGVAEDYYMPGYGWVAPANRKGKTEKLASGKSESCQDASEGRLRLRVKGNTITVWLGDERLVEHTHKGEVVEPIPYGGFGVGWRYESMGWISNLKVQKYSRR